RLFYTTTWTVWRTVAGWLPPGRKRQTFLSIFGPLSLLGLFTFWVSWLIVSFGLLHWSLGTGLNLPPDQADFGTYLYLSGVTLFTLGPGDVSAVGTLGRTLTVAEAGLGFGFMAVIIGYLPVLYQAFSRREATISMLDARASSPPSASQLLLRLTQ